MQLFGGQGIRLLRCLIKVWLAVIGGGMGGFFPGMETSPIVLLLLKVYKFVISLMLIHVATVFLFLSSWA